MTTEAVLTEYQQKQLNIKTEVVTGRITKELKERAQEKCERLGVPLSFIVEKAVQEWVDSE